MTIGWLCRYSPNMNALYGGKAYEAMLYSFLHANYDVKDIYPHANHNTPTPLKWLYEFNALRKMNVDYDVLITDFYSATMLNPEVGGRKIAIIHHLDNSQKKHPFLNDVLERTFMKNHEKINTVVVPSQYWKNGLHGKFSAVRVVYNGFDVPEYNSVGVEDVEDFKRRYHLNDYRLIIYIGPCQKAKGVNEAAFGLNSFGAKLITSGKREVIVPATHFNLSRHDFICLLKASDVVLALSKFKEGWNRVVHEAMLCKTPVVGIPLGGMRELLIGGGQKIFIPGHDLSVSVDYAIYKKKELGEGGYNFAKEFTIERFEKGWGDVLNG